MVRDKSCLVRLICHLLGVLSIALCAIAVSPAAAQAGTVDWSFPGQIGSPDRFTASPRLLEDKGGVLHAFWVENPMTERDAGETEAVMYSRWNGAEWLAPRDILVAPSGYAIADLSVAVGPDNAIHLVMIDSSGGGALYHTVVPADEAGVPQAWSPMAALASETVSSASLIAAGERLILLYSDRQPPFEARVIWSDDGGNTWSDSILLSPNVAFDEAVVDVSIAFGPDGGLHAAWASYSYPEGYPPTRIEYSSSSDGGLTWRPPVLIVEGQYGFPNVTVSSSGTVYIAYNGAAAIRGRYMAMSPDGGENWDTPVRIAPEIGGLTGNDVAIDSAGTLHWVSSSHQGGINGIAYARSSDGRQWTTPEKIAGKLSTIIDDDRGGYEPVIMATEGNRLHVLYIQGGHVGIEYVTGRSSAPHVAPPGFEAPVRVTLDDDEPTVAVEVAPAQEPTPLPVGQFDRASPTRNAFPLSTVLWISLLPSLLFLAALIALRRRPR